VPETAHLRISLLVVTFSACCYHVALFFRCLGQSFSPAVQLL